MAYRNLTFRSLAADIRTERYLGEDHIVVPCIALVGDEVVYGMNAEGPEFIPAEELEFSTLGWSGRPVLYDHPANSTSTANEPSTLQAMSFGQIFYPKFEDGKLKVEAWCNKRRALEIGQEDLISSIENGEVIELSVGAIISLEKKKGIAPNGKQFQAIWHDVQSDHLAIGLSGSQGACNIEMGCGANRVLKADSNSSEISDTRTMRANRGVDIMPELRTASGPASKSKPALPALDIKPRTLTQRILSLASKAFRSNAEDEGLSDKDLRDKLWTALYAVEPAFYGIENVYQESMTVTYITSPDGKIHLWRRTFTVADDGGVSISEDREEVAVSEFYYVYMGENPTAIIAAQASDQTNPCGCQTGNADKTVAANETNTNNDSSKEDTNVADETKPKTDAKPDASAPATPATPTTPVVPTPEKGSSEAATPSQSGNEDKTIPNYPAGEPNPGGEVPGAVTNEQLKALLEAHPLVKKYRAQEAQEKSYLVSALGKAQKVYSAEQLNAMSVDQLRPIAQLVGIGGQTQQPVGDFSGRMMVARESEMPPPPDPHGVNKYLKRGDTTN